MKKGVEIKGQVYHHGKVELLGNIYGSLYCEGFIRKTKRAYYENHLLDNVIDFKRLPVRFVGVDLFQGYDDQIIEELETNL